MRLTDASFLVTGGASGLGEATARALVAAGARVTITDLPTSAGDQTAVALGGDTHFAPADITDEVTLGEALDAAVGRGPLRGVVHCAGRGGDRLRIIDRSGGPSSMTSFEEVLRVNLVGSYNVLRLAAARMVHNEPMDGDRGAIVMTASVAAFDGQLDRRLTRPPRPGCME